MNKLFGQIFETYNDFKEKVIDYINDLENNPIYLNDPTFKYTQEKIFEIIRIYFKNSEHNYNDDELFIQSFRIKYANAFMNFYFKSNELNKIELDKLTNDWFNDIAKVESNSKSNSNATNESRLSTTPVSKQIQDLLDTLPLNNADRTTIENAITNNTLTTNQVINGYSLYQRAINSNLSLQFDNLIRKLSNMFMQIGNNLENDYKQLDADQLILLQKRVDALERAIIVLDETKQNKLIAGKDIEITPDNIINYTGTGGEVPPELIEQVETNKNDIVVLQASQSKQDEDISTLRNDLGDLGDIVNTNQGEIATIKIQQTQQDRDIADNSQAIERNTQKINDYKTSNDLEISKLKEKDSQLQNAIELKANKSELVNYQPKLKAGTNIIISEDNTISATGGSGDLTLEELQNGKNFIYPSTLFLKNDKSTNSYFYLSYRNDNINIYGGVSDMPYTPTDSNSLVNKSYVDKKINSINIFDGFTLKENTDFTISGKEIRFNDFTIPDGYAFYWNGYFETNNGDYIYPNTSINYNGGNSIFNNANSWNTGEIIPILFTGNNKLVVKSDKFSSITKVNNLRVYFKRVG